MTTGPFFQYAIRASQADQNPALLEQRDRELEDYLATLAVTPWTAVTFENSWVNFGASNQDAEYQKIGDNVSLRGLVKSGASGTTAFTLPVGFRPFGAPQYITSSDATSPPTVALIRVGTDGTVILYSAVITAIVLTGSFPVSV